MVSHLLQKRGYPWLHNSIPRFLNSFLEKIISLMKDRMCKVCLPFLCHQIPNRMSAWLFCFLNRRLRIRSFGRRVKRRNRFGRGRQKGRTDSRIYAEVPVMLKAGLGISYISPEKSNPLFSAIKKDTHPPQTTTTNKQTNTKTLKAHVITCGWWVGVSCYNILSIKFKCSQTCLKGHLYWAITCI